MQILFKNLAKTSDAGRAHALRIDLDPCDRDIVGRAVDRLEDRERMNVETWGLEAAEWLAVLRIGLGAWWLESVRHKNLDAWINRDAGIKWAALVAEEHRWSWVRTMFDNAVRPHPKFFTWVVLLSEFALGVGIAFGFLTPVALVGGLLLNLIYLLLMIHEFAEQGQNGMMLVMGAVLLGAQGWQEWSIDAWLGLF